MLDVLIRRRENSAMHLADMEYVALFHEHLRRVRGNIPQIQVACMADVTQSYISRVESGSATGIGRIALRRILETYQELESEHASRLRQCS